MSANWCSHCGAAFDGETGRCGRCGFARIVVGRAPECQYRIDKPTISAQHAMLEFRPGAGWRVCDLNSHNGTFLRDSSVRIGADFVAVQEDDVLLFARTAVGLRAIAAGVSLPPELRSAGSRNETVVFGRDISAEVTVAHPMVSARHARLHRLGEHFFIEDLGSGVGTFVNGRRIAPRARIPVKPGDEIGLGGFTFFLDEQGQMVRALSGEGISVTADGVSVHVFTPTGGLRELIGDISLTIEPGDLVALMGPSGAGKTTFLRALNGTVPPSSGRVLYRGLDLLEHFELFRTVIGYVPQHDIVHGRLTVREALYYTAKLRLPADTSDEQIDARVRNVLGSLDLLDQIDQEIGDGSGKSLSGGQRKRVNLAMELLSDPMVLFLDEPTSGLSAVDAMAVVTQLRRLADGRRTIITTIHQPSLEIFHQFTLLALISNHALASEGQRPPGRLVYFGPTADAFPFFSGPVNAQRPEEMEANLKARPVSEWLCRYQASPFHRRYVGERLSRSGGDGPAKRSRPPKNRLSQLSVLFRRAVRLKARDRAQLTIALLLPVIFGFLVAVSQYSRSQPATYQEFLDFSRRIGVTHFLMVIAAVWFGCNNAVREIVGERPIYRRERLVNLSLASYFLSKYAVLGALGLLQCLTTLLMVHWGVDLRGGFLPELGVLWVASLAGTGIGLTISSLARSTEQAIAALPLVLLPLIILGGSLTTVEEMHQRMPLGIVADLAAPTRWAFEANLAVENEALGIRGRYQLDAVPSVASPRLVDVAEVYFPERTKRHSPPTAVSRLAAMVLFWAGCTLLVLKVEEWDWWHGVRR